MPREPDEIFSRSYITLCRKQRQLISRLITPEPGDWLFDSNGLTMVGQPPGPSPDGEIFLPRLDQLIGLLRHQAAHVIVSCYPDGYSCQVMDADDQPLANVISKTPEEAALRALVFVLAERAANEQAG
ncbi:hypothetical protein [Nitrolancea hollandica]|uniref:Phage ABA sandwich domain-containing protein n=1 Tax=Nitrolancea hollandica Lb TaxID=1129897 RepID=I4END0_9BACT|nr:hypothetical protein [Nitrolancea hollandica]CCF86193.1 conserved hypothetical protein [Nitrolancea hollandica Lb]